VVDVGLEGLEGASQRELPPQVPPVRRHGTALQELDSLEPPAPSATRRRRLPRFSLRVERESSELSLCGEREGVKKGPKGAEGAGAEQAKLVETERPMDDGLRGTPFGLCLYVRNLEFFTLISKGPAITAY